MAFRTITARYPGTCKRCHGSIHVGSRMRYGGRGQTYHLSGDCPRGGVDDDTPTTDDGLRWSPRGQSGRGGYVTSSGWCEDAPCCGCCGTSLYG